MAILIVGGAGYIGSHTVKYLQDKDEDIVVVDNFTTGHKNAVDLDNVYTVDIRNQEALDEVFTKHTIESVIHFAAHSLVGESMSDPYIYYHNNVYGMMTLLDVMKNHGVNRIVFSSTAAVYGEPSSIPIKEDGPTVPTNPYGETKRAMERMMHWFEKAYGIHYVSLRYFNAAGAHPSGEIGEDHDPETHLIPLVFQVASGKRDAINIYGDDYPTKDGTCIRDYIHVMDIADAHYKALKFLRKHGKSDIFNLGSGNGYSVREIIESARKVSGHAIPATIKPRRVGDPARLIASNEKAKALLSWTPTQSIETIVRDAWCWHLAHPEGYED